MNMEAQDGTAAWHGPVVDMDPTLHMVGDQEEVGMSGNSHGSAEKHGPWNSAQSQARSHPVPAFPKGWKHHGMPALLH